MNKAALPDILTVGKKAALELRTYLIGELKLSPAQVEARKQVIRTASRQSLYFFAKIVLGFDKMTRSTHGRWADDLQARWLDTDYFGRLKPRGTFKTTLYGEAFILWVWATVSPKIRFVYTSANESLLDEVSAHLDHFISEKSDSLYAFVFGIRRDAGAQKNTQYQFNVTGRDAGAKGFSLTFRTAGGSTNGLHPHIIIVDDPCDNSDRESNAVRESKKRWFDSLIPLLVEYDLKVYSGGKLTRTVPIKKIMLVATRWHMDDVIAYVQGKPDWHFEVESAYNADGSAAYPELLPKEKLEALKRQISDVFFSCQYLNKPIPEGAQIFAKEKLHYVRKEQVDPKQGTTYCFFDPSQGKAGGDFPAVIWINVLNGRRALLRAVDKKTPLTPLLAVIAKTNKELNARVMIWETNGTMGLEDSLRRVHAEVEHNINLIAIHETRNKLERIYAMQPELYSGQILFLEEFEREYPELMNQVTFFPAWAHDDFPDTIEKAVTYFNRHAPGAFAKGAMPQRAASSGTIAGRLRR